MAFVVPFIPASEMEQYLDESREEWEVLHKQNKGIKMTKEELEQFILDFDPKWNGRDFRNRIEPQYVFLLADALFEQLEKEKQIENGLNDCLNACLQDEGTKTGKYFFREDKAFESCLERLEEEQKQNDKRRT